MNALHLDGLGSVRAVTDGTGAAVERTGYRPYGEEVAVQQPLTLPEAKGFIGERLDGDAGLQYLNARYYDPRLGMFVQPDWWEVTEEGVGTNRYSYSFNDPVNGRDPGGNNSIEIGYEYEDGERVRGIEKDEDGNPKVVVEHRIGDEWRTQEEWRDWYERLSGNSYQFPDAEYGVPADADMKAIAEVVSAIGAGRGVFQVGRWAVNAARAKVSMQASVEVAINQKIYSQLEKQLATAGPASVQKALRSAERTLVQHQEKLKGIVESGGYTSQVEGTIKNVNNQIKTLRKFIRDYGL